MKDFADLYNHSPLDVQNFLYSDDFWFFVDEAEKKFSIEEEQSIQFAYLLQDFAMGATEFDNQAGLTEALKTDVGIRADLAPSLAYMIWTRFKPLFEHLKKQAEEKQEASRQEQLRSVIAQSQKRESLLKAAQEEQMQQMRKSALDLNRVAGVATSRVPIPTRIKIPIEHEDVGEKISPVRPKQEEEKIIITEFPDDERVVHPTTQTPQPHFTEKQKDIPQNFIPSSQFHAPENPQDEMDQLQYRVIGMPKNQNAAPMESRKRRPEGAVAPNAVSQATVLQKKSEEILHFPPAKEIPQSPPSNETPPTATVDLHTLQKKDSDSAVDLSGK
ncbi:MAG: hypothetical protein UU76_C0003G0014 [Parcubacteria group bacterium GW2011_GWC1_41_7]|nr:MAG: hypothetical protein UU76_C0003G0014 [Parcubacteria group bacterium GW2011_GWC1_41_7]